jgi:methionyl-tRNA synthetase
VLKETNYFFTLSKFQDQLLELYTSRPDFIQPDSVRNEIVAFVNRGLDDLSISRSTFEWGIDIPWDSSHVTYVWFEALLNYITATGWGSDEENFSRRWPAVQLVGKDIARFHAVIWPAMLMAAGLEPPARVFAHGWLLVGGEKMSKSKLTGIAPSDITDVFGADAFRYYFMRAITFGQDGSFSWEDLAARYEAELANGWGNLASRVIAMVSRYFDGVIPDDVEDATAADVAIHLVMEQAQQGAHQAMQRFAINEAIAQVWTIVDALNGYLTEQEPWVLAKDDSAGRRLARVLYTAADGLRATAILLSPIMPTASEKLWSALGAEATLGALGDQLITEAGAHGVLPPGAAVSDLAPLFPRIETSEG